MDTQELTIEIQSNGRVILILPDKDYKPRRQIGKIDFETRTFITSRKSSNQCFRNLNAIGLNYKLLAQGEKYFDWIRIDYDFEVLETSREYFLEFGEFKHFKQNNLDKQIFLSLGLFGLDPVSKWEFEKAEREKAKKKSIKKLTLQFSMF